MPAYAQLVTYAQSSCSRSKVQVRHVERVWRVKLASGLNGPHKVPFRGSAKKQNWTHHIHINYQGLGQVMRLFLDCLGYLASNNPPRVGLTFGFASLICLAVPEGM